MRLLVVLVVVIAVTMADSGHEVGIAAVESGGALRAATASSATASSVASASFAVSSAAGSGIGLPARRETGYGPVTVFNNPRGSAGQRGAISRHIRGLIRGASRGSYIHLSMFHFSSRTMAGALVHAARRGVRVRIVLDGDSVRYRAYRVLRRGLGRNLRRGSWVTLCPRGRGCIGPGAPGRAAINHNKFALFSRTSGRRNVVLQTSANMTEAAERRQWNNAVTFADTTVYAGYLQYFWDQARRRTTPDYRRMVVSGRYAVQFFPRLTDDPVLAALNAVSCTRGTRVRAVVAYLTWMPVVRRLRDLAGAGCSVELVASGISVSAGRELTGTGSGGGGPRGLRVRYSPGGRRASLAHSKYLLIEGGYMGRQRRAVFTGSVNFTTPGFRRNDEALLTISDHDRTYRAYARDFGVIWKLTRRLPPPPT
jgi:phosphatidylserine/phosphatidylglycerophosphate/cardiolipin synthase-like enzyme